MADLKEQRVAKMEQFVNKLKQQEIQKQAEKKKLEEKSEKFRSLVWGKKAKKAVRELPSSSEEEEDQKEGSGSGDDSEEERRLMAKLKKLQAKKKQKSKVIVDEKVEKLKEIEKKKGYKHDSLIKTTKVNDDVEPVQ